MNRRHPRAASQRAVPVFERCAQFFERGVGRVVIARVAETGFLAPENTVELLHAVVEIARRKVNRRGDGNMATGPLAISRVHGLGMRFYFLFHRTPSFVSSRITPSASNSSRMRSASAKLRAFLACARAA